MSTIFDYEPTERELVELFSYDKTTESMAYGFSVFKLSIKEYDKENDEDGKILDLAKLFELRGQEKEAAAVWAKIPDIYRQYKGGFDNQIIPS